MPGPSNPVGAPLGYYYWDWWFVCMCKREREREPTGMQVRVHMVYYMWVHTHRD